MLDLDVHHIRRNGNFAKIAPLRFTRQRLAKFVVSSLRQQFRRRNFFTTARCSPKGWISRQIISFRPIAGTLLNCRGPFGVRQARRIVTDVDMLRAFHSTAYSFVLYRISWLFTRALAAGRKEEATTRKLPQRNGLRGRNRKPAK